MKKKVLTVLLLITLCSCAQTSGRLERSVLKSETLVELTKVLGEQDPEFLVAHGPLTTKTSRKLFNLLVKSDPQLSEVTAVGHFAAYTGDTELLRKVVYTYFGSAEAESKTGYVERFLLNHPHLFFSLPDTYDLWSHAGGAAIGLEYPARVEKVVAEFAFYNADAKKILSNIEVNK